MENKETIENLVLMTNRLHGQVCALEYALCTAMDLLPDPALARKSIREHLDLRIAQALGSNVVNDAWIAGASATLRQLDAD